MTQRTSWILRFPTLIIAAGAAVALAAGVATAEPSGDGARREGPPAAKGDAKPGAKRGERARGGKYAKRGKARRGHRGARAFKRFDSNQDGKLQQSEVPSRVWQRISVADANGDKAVTKAELQKAREQGKLPPRRGHHRGKQRRG